MHTQELFGSTFNLEWKVLLKVMTWFGGNDFCSSVMGHRTAKFDLKALSTRLRDFYFTLQTLSVS